MAMLPAKAVTSGIMRGLARSEDRFVPSHDRALPFPGKDGTAPHLANTLSGFILRTSGRHQLALAAITVLLCLVITLPLELQRRIVNDALQRRDFRTIGVLALAYFAAVIVQRGIKLAMNVYRSWVSESSTRYLRSTVLGSDRRAGDNRSGSQRGVDISIVLAEADPIGSFVGASVSEPLLQFGVLFSLLAYMAYLHPWMALIALGALTLQMFFVPMMQNAINRRATERILTLRAVSTALNRGGDTPSRQLQRADHVFALNMDIYKIKYFMNFLMSGSVHLSMAGILALGGYFVSIGEIDAGSVVACVAGLSKISDPWGDFVDWFRDLRVTQARYALLRAAELRSFDAEHHGNSGFAWRGTHARRSNPAVRASLVGGGERTTSAGAGRASARSAS
jgi:ABC-type bacteriocin/lantibiotic exporter with double-glycine peptidase domain